MFKAKAANFGIRIWKTVEAYLQLIPSLILVFGLTVWCLASEKALPVYQYLNVKQWYHRFFYY